MNRSQAEDANLTCRRVAGQIQALVDGSLSPDQAHDAEDHCSTCPSCCARLAQARAVWSLLLQDWDPVFAGKLWPLVNERLHPARSLASRLSWTGATAFAAAAGLALGLILAPDTTTTAEAWEQATWGEVGSLLAEGSGLDQIYLDVAADISGEEASP